MYAREAYAKDGVNHDWWCGPQLVYGPRLGVHAMDGDTPRIESIKKWSEKDIKKWSEKDTQKWSEKGTQK